MSRGGAGRRGQFTGFMVRLYGVLMRFLPRGLREDYGIEMSEMLRARAIAEGGVGLQSARFWASAFVDLTKQIIAETRDSLARLLGRAPRGASNPGPRRPFMDTLFQDIRYGLRMVQRGRGFAALTVLILAIGIAANTAMFSVMNGLFFRPIPGIQDEAGLVELRVVRSTGSQTSISYPELSAMRESATPFEYVVGWQATQASVAIDGPGERLSVMYVSADYFNALGVRATLGRVFVSEEDIGPGEHPVVVLSHAYWQERFSGDPTVIGSIVNINRAPSAIVGVTPPDFISHNTLVAPDMWLPMMQYAPLSGENSWIDQPGTTWLTAFARLAPGATKDQAQSAVNTTFARLAEEFPEYNAQRSGAVFPFEIVPNEGRNAVLGFLGLLMAFTGLILLTTCANVAGMVLARSAARTREVAIRLALGSGRRRLIRQLVTESMVLFVLGGVLGTAFAFWLTRFLDPSLHPLPETVTLGLDFSPDARLLAFSIGITVVTGLIFGLVPALHSTRTQLITVLREDGAAGSRVRSRLRGAFVAGQVAISLVLVISAGLFLRSLQMVGGIDVGFEPANVYMTNIDLSLEGYDSPEEGVTLFQRMIDEAAGRPGVLGATVGVNMPLDLSGNYTLVYPEGWDEESSGIRAATNQIMPGYFEVLRLPIQEGRGITTDDRAGGERVVVVSRALAEVAWPGEAALGRVIRIGSEAHTIVGISGDTKDQMISEPAEPAIYAPLSQRYQSNADLVIRLDPRVANAAETMRDIIASTDPSISITNVLALESLARLGTFPQRAAAYIASWLGLLALILSGIGLYGVVAFGVARQTREIGIKMALGADRRAVILEVLRGGLRFAIPGIIVGVALALGLGVLLRSLLLGVSPADPIAYAVVTLLLLGVVTIATYLPASRAASIRPQEALRHE